MNKSTIIKATVAGIAVVGGILLGDNEQVRGMREKALGLAGDVEKAIKNPLGSLASVATASAPKETGYYDYLLEKQKAEYRHKERMAELEAKKHEEAVAENP